MNPVSPPFVVPVTFWNQSELRDEQDSLANPLLLESSFANARPSALVAWSSCAGSKEPPAEAAGSLAVGMILACEDGTLFVFRTSTQASEVALQLQEPRAPSNATNPHRLSRGSYSRSRPGSPSNSSHAPFHITSRSRIVSGITHAQVEAPTNYVDFDDEPEKLKDMLMGRSPRERSPEPAKEKSPAHSVLNLVLPGIKRKDAPKSLLSATNSPSFTPPIALSSPVSPDIHSSFPQTTCGAKLLCHIIPSTSGSGKSVAALQLLDANRLLAVLHETGYISVFSTEDGSCLSSTYVDANPLQPPAGIPDRDASYEVWKWITLQFFHLGQSTLLLASAAVDLDSSWPGIPTTQDNDLSHKSRLVLYEFWASNERGPFEVRLEKVGQWYFDGSAISVGVHRDGNGTAMFYINPDGHFVLRRLQLLPRNFTLPLNLPPEDTHSNHLPSLPLPNPFKTTKARSVEQVTLDENKEELGRIGVSDEEDAGQLRSDCLLVGLRTLDVDGKLRGICWSERDMTAFEYARGSLRMLFFSPVVGIQDLKWIDEYSYAAEFADRFEFYLLQHVDANNEPLKGEIAPSSTTNIQPRLLSLVTSGLHQASHIISASEILVAELTKDGRQCIKQLTSHAESASGRGPKPRTLWRASRPRSQREAASKVQLTSMLPLELDLIVLGYNDGHLRRSSLAQLYGQMQNTSVISSEPALDGYIVALHVVQNSRTNERFIVGGADDGSIAFWALNSLKLCARWTIFTTPLSRVLQFRDQTVGTLRGCVLCIAQDGTVAVVVVDGFQFLYLIPGSAAALQRVCIGEDNLILVYADRRARLWDAKAKELWRSMGVDKAEELIDQGGWTEISLETRGCLPDIALKTVSGDTSGPDAVSTISLDLERFITESTTTAKSISTSRDQTRAILSTLDHLRLILSSLLTPGLNEDIDLICQEQLGINATTTSVGFTSGGSTSTYRGDRPQDAWCVSREVSASRALSVIVVLRALSLFEEFSHNAGTVIAFYATSLAPVVGNGYHPPSLSFLARRWFDGSNELRLAARMLFDASVSCLSDEETNMVAEHWQHHLPCLQPTADRESLPAALALFICGHLAAEKYTLLSGSALTDISKSIALYLHDEQSIYRVLAIDLCSRGFHIWQHYIDAMEILRALFTLATSSRKEAISAQNVGPQARLAVLQIASSDTPLFITTLSLDILNPLSVDHRKSVMQIVAFLIRKRPLVLYPNMPRLMEAVVKSLDPNLTSHRDAVLDTATEILGHVVKTFPTVDFHMATQRLAVGTSEGAIVMYDLKTAVRLYVLESHKKRISACSFSPDGRRLVTLSLEESVVLVWKVGSSFSSFFYPGAPPRQGHGGSEPFKTLSFNVGDEGKMTVSEAMQGVKFEWTAERSVKLKIRDSTLTFST